MSKIGLAFFSILACLAAGVGATNYYVSPSGVDTNTGLSPTTAWRSIDRGDVLGITHPGDTVNILPGTYSRTTSVTFSLSGGVGSPIVYRRLGKAPAIVNLGWAAKPAIIITGSNITIQGITITNANDDGIRVEGHNCTITACYVHDVGKDGIKVRGSNNRLIRNIIHSVSGNGIKNEDAATQTAVYGNTVYSNDGSGFEGSAGTKTARLFNNIVCKNDKGVNAKPEVICGYNNVWSNTGGNYAGGCSDSAGGISIHPQFVNAADGRFDLLHTAAEINAGVPLDYPYSQTAPEMGAVEKYTVYYVRPDGNDNATGRTVDQAWRTIDNGDSLLLPGDTAKILPGTYTDSIGIAFDGLVDDHIVYVEESDGARVEVPGAFRPVRLDADHTTWSGIDVAGAINADIYVTGGRNYIENAGFSSSATYGIQVATGARNTIARCTFENNEVADLYLASDSAYIYNNTFYSSFFGIDALNSGNHEIINNAFRGALGASAGIRATTTTMLTYSMMYGFAQNVQGGVVLGIGCGLADPLLVDPAGGNLRLSSRSPAIDAGTDIGFPSFGSAPDMGAFETRALTSLTIIPSIDSMRADTSQQFDVVAVDDSGYPANFGRLTWSHTFADGTIDSTGLFLPGSVGAGSIHVVSDIDDIAASTASVVVVPGRLATLTVTPYTDTVSADSSLQFAASGFDIKGNEVTDPGRLTWSATNGIGTLDSTGLFSATHAGKGLVGVVSDVGVTGFSDTITVIPGAMAHIDVLPSENIVHELTSYQYVAFGYDSDSNFVGDYTNSATWTTTDVTGSITSHGLYSAGWISGNYFVKGRFDGKSDSGTVQVTTGGGLNHILVERLDGSLFNDTILTTDNDNTRLYARGYTSDGTLIGDVVVTWSVAGNDSIGVVNPVSGTWCQLALLRPGAGQVIAVTQAGRSDSTGIITCRPGIPNRLIITPAADTVSADETIQFSCQTFDADGNVTNPMVIATWAVRGTIGDITSGGLFTPYNAGSGKVICSGASLADTADPVVVTAGALTRIAVHPDSAVITADSVLAFSAAGYDQKDNTCSPGELLWSVTNPIGTIDASGVFHPTALGVTRAIAVSGLGPVDTSGYLRVTAGRLAQLIVSPDSVEVTVDDRIIFSAVGTDYLGNPTTVGNLAWEVTGDIGNINSLGEFTPSHIGTGRVVAQSVMGGVSDTNGSVTVAPGLLRQLVISPDSATLQIGDTLAFSAVGYDAAFNATGMGNLTWNVDGGIGTIDSLGLFTAASSGHGSVSAQSDVNSVRGSSGVITVEAIAVSSIPLGTIIAYPGQTHIPGLVFSVANPYANDKHITGIVLHDGIRGIGSPEQLRSNIAGVSLFVDRDGDSLLNEDDSLIASGTLTADSLVFDLQPLLVAAGGSVTMIAAFDIALYPHDGDTLDIFLHPETDILTAESTAVTGPATVNSLGYGVVDGMVAGQMQLVKIGRQTLIPDDSVFNILTVDVPCNGYRLDTLQSLKIIDFLGMSEENFDSLILYVDNGNGAWGGPAEERRLGKLIFSGEEWLRSGLNLPLTNVTTRLFVGANLIDYPVNNTTVAFGVPRNGLEMKSSNDGPLDDAISPVDTILIQSNEKITVWSITIPPTTITPGMMTGPLLSLQLKNACNAARALDTLRCSLIAFDTAGATQIQLDSQIDTLFLYMKKDADATVIRSGDSLLATAFIQNGSARFTTTGLAIAGNGGTVSLCIAAAVNLDNAKNGNTLAFGLDDSSAVVIAGGTTVTGTFPIRNDSLFTIDAFPAAAVHTPAIPAVKLTSGQTAQEVMAFDLPGNGYAEDRLYSLELANVGSLDDKRALATVKLWRDRTGDGYTADDSLVRQFDSDGDSWRINNIDVPLQSQHTRFLVTATVTNLSFDGGTLQFEIPSGGVTCRSGRTGPDDASVRCPATHFVFPSNRVTVISVPTGMSIVAPGDTGKQVLVFAMYNGYTGQNKTFSGFTLTNASHGLSAPEYSDYELGQVSLYYDDNNNRIHDNDSLIAAGSCADGRLRFGGFTIPLPAESLAYFFICADLPLDITDGDSLSAGIAGASDISFSEPVNLNGDIPLSAGGALIVDGSVRRQYQVLNLAAKSLRPGETGVPVFAFQPAPNGDRADILQSVTLDNTLDADSSDLSSLRLWLDNNDDRVWQATDSLLTGFGYMNGNWVAGGIGLPIGSSPKTLFVLADISSQATPNTKLHFEIPVNGCVYGSQNDGPRDSVVCGNSIFTISDFGLGVAMAPIRPTYSIGQPIPVEIFVSDLLATPLDSVVGMIVETTDTSLVTLDSLNAGPYDLDAGGTTVFSFYYTGREPGPISWALQAVAATAAESSAVVSTDIINIQSAASGGSINLINSTPTAVTRGQENVFPLTLQCFHRDSASATAPLRLDSLCLRIEDVTGAGIPADHVFSRVILSAGYSNRVIYDSIPADSVLTLRFERPVIVMPGQRCNLSLLVDIAPLAEASSFRLAVNGPSDVRLVDDNTGESVPLTANGEFPLRTAVSWIHDPAQHVMVSASSLVRATVNYGQRDVDIMQVNIRHTGGSGSSSVQVTDLTVVALDSAGNAVLPNELFTGISIVRDQQVMGDRSFFSPESTAVLVHLGSPLNLNYGQRDSLRVVATLNRSALTSGFRMGILDSTAFVVRDINTGATLEAASDTAALATGLVFPMLSDWAAFRRNAPSPDLCLTSELPPSIVAGTDAVAMMTLRFNHPGTPDYSSVRIDGVDIAVTDSLGAPQDPNRLFNRIGFRIDDNQVEYQTYITTVASMTRFVFGDTGLALTPGETITVRLIGDIDAEAPYDNFRLSVDHEDKIEAYDCSDGQPTGQTPSGDCPFTFPVISAAAGIFLPAGRPTVTPVSLPTALSFPGDTAVTLFQAQFDYQGLPLQGDLTVHALKGQMVHRTESGLTPVAASEIFRSVRLLIDGQIIAADTVLVSDGIELAIDPDAVIPRGTDRPVTLMADIRATASKGNYLIQFADSTFIEVLDRNLLSAVYPLVTPSIYPLAGVEIAITAAGLEESFSNYPNPFFPSRGEVTTIGYVLPEDARVDIEIFSITGELVKTVAAQTPRTAGPHQTDRWVGVNDNGRDVISGTYFCRITARYSSGKVESYRRKVAVIR